MGDGQPRLASQGRSVPRKECQRLVVDDRGSIGAVEIGIEGPDQGEREGFVLRYAGAPNGGLLHGREGARQVAVEFPQIGSAVPGRQAVFDEQGVGDDLRFVIAPELDQSVDDDGLGSGKPGGELQRGRARVEGLREFVASQLQAALADEHKGIVG